MIEQIFAVLMSFVMSFLSFFGIIVPHYDTYNNIKYGESAMQTMDIYVPEGAAENKSNSAVIFLHGGMFKSGDKSEMINDCQRLAERGYITVTMDYSLIGSNSNISFFTMLDDIDNAIDRLEDFSIENNLNIRKLALAGNSAGGCLALYYSYANPLYSAIDLTFVAAKVAPSDFDYSIWESNYSKATFADLVSNLSTIKVSPDNLDSTKSKEACQLISPVHYIDSTTEMPTLLAYAGKDDIVPYGNKTSIESKLRENKVKFDLVDFSNSKHDMMFDLLKNADYNNLLLNYCEKYL